MQRVFRGAVWPTSLVALSDLWNELRCGRDDLHDRFGQTFAARLGRCRDFLVVVERWSPADADVPAALQCYQSLRAPPRHRRSPWHAPSTVLAGTRAQNLRDLAGFAASP